MSDVKPWMKRWMFAAGIYNLLWGATVVLAPLWLFTVLGVEPPAGIGLPIWQCVGMIVGVYGVGYLAAAKDPLRHWPSCWWGCSAKSSAQSALLTAP